MDSERTACLNYEAEYERLLEEKRKLQEEVRYLSEKSCCLQSELEQANAKLSIVYLIFGG